eukprot:4453882-Alexandrium_andersonii.AAC.1
MPRKGKCAKSAGRLRALRTRWRVRRAIRAQVAPGGRHVGGEERGAATPGRTHRRARQPGTRRGG